MTLKPVDELVGRLRARMFSRWESDIQAIMEYEDDDAHEAADLLAAQAVENKRLREALELASHFVEQAVKDDGGVDNCEMGDRLAARENPRRPFQ